MYKNVKTSPVIATSPVGSVTNPLVIWMYCVSAVGLEVIDLLKPPLAAK